MLSLIVRLFLSPLAAAAESGFLELVRILLDAGALDDPDEDGTCLAALGVLQSGKAERVADASCCMMRHCLKMKIVPRTPGPAARECFRLLHSQR